MLTASVLETGHTISLVVDVVDADYFSVYCNSLITLRDLYITIDQVGGDLSGGDTFSLNELWLSNPTIVGGNLVGWQNTRMVGTVNHTIGVNDVRLTDGGLYEITTYSNLTNTGSTGTDSYTSVAIYEIANVTDILLSEHRATSLNGATVSITQTVTTLLPGGRPIRLDVTSQNGSVTLSLIHI